MDLKVLYEDNHLIAINKPAGYLVQGDQTGDRTMADVVKSYIKLQYNKPGDVFLGVVHRLDRPVSGVLIYARTSKGLSRMNELFKKREIEKTYWAVVTEQPQPIEGKLVHYILKDSRKNRAHAFDKLSRRHEGAKKAELSYKLLGRIGRNCLLEVKPKTGRPHQIRVQLSKLGVPIRGDIKYGYPDANLNGNINLHCRSMSFIHPVKKEPVRITADLPHDDDIWQLFGSFR